MMGLVEKGSLLFGLEPTIPPGHGSSCTPNACNVYITYMYLKSWNGEITGSEVNVNFYLCIIMIIKVWIIMV